MNGTCEETGWNGLMYQGVKVACDGVGVKLLVKENISENSGQCPVAIEELVREGAGMIILGSYGYEEESIEVIKKYSDVIFYSESSDISRVKNVTNFFPKMYQARYLAGIIAGMTTNTNRIGYVAAMNNVEVNRGINAFTLGVRSVNPQAQVFVRWSGSWSSEGKERMQAQRLVQEDQVDVLTCHQNLPYVVEEAEQLNVCSIGYHEPYANATEKMLTVVQCDWKRMYEEIIKDYRGRRCGTGQVLALGMEQEVVGLTPFSSLVSEEIIQQVEAAQVRIQNGEEIFSGRIYDTQGTLRCDEGEMISNETLWNDMNWYVEGVVIYEN